MTEFYPRRRDAIGGLLWAIVFAGLSLIDAFDTSTGFIGRTLGAACLMFLAFGGILMAMPALRRKPDLSISDEGFTHVLYRQISWAEVDHLQLGSRQTKTNRTEPYVEVVLRDLHATKPRSDATGDGPIIITPGTLPVPIDTVVAAMQHHYPSLVVFSEGSTGDDTLTIDMVEQALATEVTRMLPAGWEFAMMWFALVGETGGAGIQIRDKTGSDAELKPSERVLTLLSAYKTMSYIPQSGTWLNGTISITDRGHLVELSRTEIPDWLPIPHPDDLRRELTAYPRADAEIPDWVQLLLS